MKRFWDKVDIRGPDACWIWTAALFVDRYGRFWHRMRNAQAHRVAWELTNGPITAGLCVLHRCDVRACVNPAHLFLGTVGDNQRDMARKGRAAQGENHPMAKLTLTQVAEIRRRYHESSEKLGSEFGVSGSAIRRIRLGETWPLTLDEYQSSLEDWFEQRPDSLTYAILGLAGECGEVVEEYKKALREKSPGDIADDCWVRERLIDELGDVLWYLCKIAKELGVPLSQVAARNMAKLEKRKKYGKEET